VLSPGHDPVRALRERATQNALAGLGYPVPRVLIASADRGLLGAGFLVMERAAGRPLLAARRPGVGRALAEAVGRAGATVAVHFHASARGADEAVKAIRADGNKAAAFQADQGNAAEVAALATDERAEWLEKA